MYCNCSSADSFSYTPTWQLGQWSFENGPYVVHLLHPDLLHSSYLKMMTTKLMASTRTWNVFTTPVAILSSTSFPLIVEVEKREREKQFSLTTSSWWSMAAPRLTRCLATSRCPSAEARCNAVWPVWKKRGRSIHKYYSDIRLIEIRLIEIFG